MLHTWIFPYLVTLGRWMMKKDYFVSKNRNLRLLNRFSMTSLKINHFLISFIFYSLLGWIIETCFIFFSIHQFIARGWIQYGLPLIPIYGVCCLILVKLLSPLKKKPLLIFGGTVFFTTMVEYIIGLILTKIFHLNFWNYNNLPFSIQGIISLPVSFAWGFLSLLMIYWIDPNLKRIINRIPALPATLISGSIMIYSAFCSWIFINRYFLSVLSQYFR
jgi:uncharacterized membrane protein